MRLLIFGPQASGKGTQAEILAKRFNIPHVSIGELLRAEIASGSDLGKELKKTVDAGEMVSDDITDTLVRKVIDENRGFILDGYPRNSHQVEHLNSITEIDRAILLSVPDKVSIERISGRRECPDGHDYHVKYKPPKKEGVCDVDGKELRMRSDDTEDAIRHRLRLYHENTEPIISHYKDVLLEIDGTPRIEEVSKVILESLE